ncbi:MAG TPA: S9 family peptidase [Gemmatimonadaceae bacterium]|nr:S9 family peptidase [Gemmatimonadaceae bacterium]
MIHLPVVNPHLLRAVSLCACLTVALPLAQQSAAQSGGKRAMTFLDVQLMKQAGSPTLSPNGRWLLYTLSTMNWKDARRSTDIWVVATDRGAASARQLTFTADKNEGSPRWARDGSFFVFSSNRDTPNNASQQQLYVMRPDGGEARKITSVTDGVGQFAFTYDGRWLIYAAGKTDEQQLWMLPVTALESATPVQLTKHPTPVRSWQVARDGQTLFFVSPDTVDKDNKLRMEKKFDVRVRNEPLPAEHIWSIDLATKTTKRLTSDAAYSVRGFALSDDGKWLAFSGTKNDRYARNITEEGINADLYLVDVASAAIERLTNNVDIGESVPSFSPDGQWIAFSAANDFSYFRDAKVYLRRVADKGGQWKKLGMSYDGDVTVGWWSDDGKTIYFSDGVRATQQLMALDIANDKVTQITQEKAVTNVQYDEDAKLYLIAHSDPRHPPSAYVARSVDELRDKSKWTQVTNPNPQAADWLLGDAEEITWKSKDGKMVGGVLVKPADYQLGRRYPLIVAIHGGPAGADVLGFNGGYGSQIYAGAGYAVLMPNYRGSTNYGEAHKLGIVGDYFKKGYEDIITGVDHLIASGLVHPDSMGALGWSAGGHWSNWILVNTTRFKAISTGAGTSNWISMYAQSDVQRNRQNYLGGKLPYDDFEAYWKQSPLRYIKNAKTPTMIHVVDGDPRVPRPQSDELHMALKKLGVPTEYYVYPGMTHGIPDPRNQLLKSVSEMMWMDHWIRGKPKFQWKDVLKTLEEAEVRAGIASPATSSAR